jgi:hypothetical protein
MLTIFMMMTTSGWMYVMYDGIFSTYVDHNPQTNFNIYYGYYFILIMIISSFFLQKLFIGIIISKYSIVRDKQSKDHILSRN